MLNPFAEPTLQLADKWYEEAKPFLFDPASFTDFLKINESALMGDGLLLCLAGRLYVVNPFFDNYMRLNVNFGLLAQLMASHNQR